MPQLKVFPCFWYLLILHKQCSGMNLSEEEKHHLPRPLQKPSICKNKVQVKPTFTYIIKLLAPGSQKTGDNRQPRIPQGN